MSDKLPDPTWIDANARAAENYRNSVNGRLDHITAVMKEFVAMGAADPECSHASADKLLIEAVRLLGPKGEEIADLWDQVERWYA